MLRVIFFIAFFYCSAAEEYSRKDEGYPQGIFTHCAGSTKPAVIKPNTLKKLFITIYGENRKCSGSYDYYHMDNLAKNPDIDFSKKTFLFIGGYLDSNAWHSGNFMGTGYKAYGYNVLSLDMLEFTATFYNLAARLSRAVGRHVAEMLVQLTDHGLDPKKLEIVGMSLGAHTMSFAAKNYRLMTGKNISSLTALDPAGPCFRSLGPDQRLDKSDADFVVGVVTNMDIAGIAPHISHVTFYVNGGAFQEGYFSWFPCDYVCSHVRSYLYWWSALIYPGAFIGVRCDSVQQARDGDCYDLMPMVTNTMDLHIDRSKTGIYYVRTSNRWPFALGKRGLKKHRFYTYSGQVIKGPERKRFQSLLKNL